MNPRSLCRLGVLTVALASASFAGEVRWLFRGAASDAGAVAPGRDWQPYAPRDEIAPRRTKEARAGRAGGAALLIDAAGNPAAFGGWQQRVDGLAGGRTYRFTAWYRTAQVKFPRRSVIARLEWQDANGRAVRPPDYPIDRETTAGWTRMDYVTQVPDNVRALTVRLALGFTPGSVWWDDVALVEEPAPPARVVRALTVHHRPAKTGSPAESVEQFCQLVEAAATSRLDLVCLPEGISVVGTGRKYADVSEAVPGGPTTVRLGVLARKLQSHIVAGIYERAGPVVYNTAVLIGRRGELVGAYRKTHLPREEWEAGITPGDEYPVFDTDFGRVGLLVCWDVQFPEPARAMAARGAEILLLPIWGGSELLARARAIENSVFLISSSYDMRTFIVDPLGAVLAEADRGQPVAVAELTLDQQYRQKWLGDMKTRTWKERRPDLPLD